jgi:hypothetical protein
MKRVLILLITALTLSSCQGPAGRDGLDGKDGKDGSVNWFISNVTVNSTQWQLVSDGGQNALNSYFRAEVSIPELTEFVYENGNVFCYMFQNVDGVEVQTLLPFTVPYGESNGELEYLWTETYACDFAVGSVVFYVNYSDFFTEKRPPSTSFRIVLNW